MKMDERKWLISATLFLMVILTIITFIMLKVNAAIKEALGHDFGQPMLVISIAAFCILSFVLLFQIFDNKHPNIKSRAIK